MIIHNVEQGSPEWLKLRYGIPTASDFHKILTPTGKLSAQAREFAFKLIAEKILNEPISQLNDLEWVHRGKMLEPDAVAQYEMLYDKQTDKIGFITNDAGTIGCSPDRFVKNSDKDFSLLEIKCPAPATHIGYLIDGFDLKYKPQVQGQLYITNLLYCEWFSYHPTLPPVLMRMERDEQYIEQLHTALTEFIAMKDDLEQRVRAKGVFEYEPNTILAAG